MFKLSFNTDNDAFQHADPFKNANAVVRCLIRAEVGINNLDRDGKIMDANGVTVGQWAWEVDGAPKDYSVLLLYPDYLAAEFGHDTFFADVEASTPSEATEKAQVEAAVFAGTMPGAGDPSEYLPEDFHVLLVVEGKHANVKGTS